MQEYYKILGVTEDISDEELKSTFDRLKRKYTNEMFLEGEQGNQAAKMLTKVENAYDEIVKFRQENNQKTGDADLILKVETLIKEGNLSGAQNLLDEFSERGAEWHYLQSVVFYKKNWNNESKKQLEIAVNLDPNNEKYSKALEKLKKNMEYNERKFKENKNYGSDCNPETNRQMGGSNECCTFCATWLCMDMLCSCCR